jgi:hypothetical protein
MKKGKRRCNTERIFLSGGKVARVPRMNKLFPLLAALALPFSLGSVGLLGGCGGDKPPEAKTVVDVAPKTIDSDALALLPSGPIAIARIDAKAMFAAGSSGAELGKLATKFLPIGAETGFEASRDLSQVVAASYSLQGVDALSILSGTFDADKIQKTADSKTPLKGGGTLTAVPYAGNTIYTSKDLAFTVLSPKTAMAGTETAVRRALDRVREGIPTRSIPEVFATVLDGPTPITGVADFKKNPLGRVAVGPMVIPGTDGLQMIRLVGDFKSPGVNIAATATYDTEEHTQAGVAAAEKLAKLAKSAGAIAPVPKLQGFEAKAQKIDVIIKFAVDDRELTELLKFLPSVLGAPQDAQ